MQAITRKRQPGTGVVILSQYDDPDYAISLLAEGTAGYAYLPKDWGGRGGPAPSGRAGGGTVASMLDPPIALASRIRHVSTGAVGAARPKSTEGLAGRAE